MGEGRYRADIDGLRAVAVLSVLAFHAGLRGVYGGYVGVDVFFVISGFLITGIIEGGLQRGGFSIAEFYKRRVHRIFPALLVMMAATTVVATVVLLPTELARYGKSLAATALFSSNILFYLESGYFDAEAAVKPLLHTWSLAIEEQFYIFWPVLLMLAHRFGWRARWLAVAIALTSLALSAWQIKADASADFYLLPSRAWELLLGALVAMDLFPPLRARWTREVAGGLGVALILIAVHFFTAQTPFPGLAAMVPCAGAALVIHAGREGGSLTGRLLGSPPMRAVGLVSYSLYLWHWPVIVFAKIGLFLPFTLPMQTAIVGLSLVLAVLSWWFIERPFQAMRPRTSHRIALSAALGVITLVCVGGGLLVATKGLPGRYTPAQAQVAAYADYDGDSRYRGGRCFLSGARDRFDAPFCLRRTPGRPAVLLVGDSHAAHLWPGLSALAGRFDLLQATSAGCKPVVGPQPGALPRCVSMMSEIFGRVLPSQPVDVVVIAARWREGDLSRLPVTLAVLKAHARRVVLVGPAPQYDTALPRLLVAADRRGDGALPSKSRDPEPTRVDAALRPIATKAGVDYVSLKDALCRPECRTLAAPGVPMQFDYGHFTVEGSRLAAAAIAPDLPGAPGAHP